MRRARAVIPSRPRGLRCGDADWRHRQRVRGVASEGADVRPVYSPDGRFLLWTGPRGEGRSSQIHIADFEVDLEAPSERRPDRRSDRVGSRESGASRDRGEARL